MKVLIFLITIFALTVMANESESLFWNEVKDTNDLELLKLYKKKYPNGIFEPLADIKINRINKSNKKELKKDGIPTWLKGNVTQYRYYGVGKANQHFKGKHYQENLARGRAKKELMIKLEKDNLRQEELEIILNDIEEEKYINKKNRIYILLYIDSE
ncbi:MAG: hypothetical protein U9R37_03945 [Campylobacterota bacterium]|nr:hypothetical protein [Campylobacterota bacterium]